jgi:prepilin peptidase CpaA
MGIGLALWLPFWLLGLLGAGDVKYFAAASFWVGAALAWRAALLAALVGGALGVLVLVKRGGVREAFSNVAMQAQQAELLIASADVSASEARQRTFPYALPMAIGIGVAALWSSRLMSI